jgi:NADPH2:quinone reductase
MRALCFSGFGGPEVLEHREVPDPAVGEAEALVRTRAIGLNFADVYRRRGNYHLTGTPPWIAGYEAAAWRAASLRRCRRVCSWTPRSR